MYNVLIVDDEEPVLESYEFMLNSFSDAEGTEKPFSLAGKARTGYEALRLIHELKPDIVFLDINIPGIDGLAVLEDVYKKSPNMVCILSTAYERFDLARRAIPLGTFAYLVKPVSKKTFFSTLENALAKLSSLPPISPELTDPRLSLFHRDIWAEMDEQRWAWYRAALSLPSDFGFVFMAELENDMEVWVEKIAAQISFKYHCLHYIMLNRVIFLISEDINPAIFRQKTIKPLEKLLESVTWYYGLGGCHRGPELCHSCSEAQAELNAKRREPDTWSNVSKRIAVLRQKLGLSSLDEAKSLFASIWEPLFYEDFSNARVRMVSLFTLLLDDLYGCWSLPSRKNSGEISPVVPFDPAEIMDLPDLDAWKLWAELNFKRLFLQANLERQGSYPLPLIKAVTFIRDNFSRGIQLADAAEAAQVNTAYLSRLFSEHLKTNFIDYLTSLRINEAERLLKNKPITVKEAAIASGYQDPNYFSKLFKKIKGILPTEVAKE